MSKQIRFVSQDSPVEGQSVAEVAVFDESGNPVTVGGVSDYTLPAASAAAIGGVKLATVTALVASADSVAAAGDTPTKAEYDAVVALANELKFKVNSLINASRAAGQAASA